MLAIALALAASLGAAPGAPSAGATTVVAATRPERDPRAGAPGDGSETLPPRGADALAAATDSAGADAGRLPPGSPGSPDDVRVRGWRTGMLGADKLEHASLSLTAGLMLGIATREPAAALTGAFALGLGKELWDRKRTFFDPRDLMADLVGAAAAALITHALTR